MLCRRYNLFNGFYYHKLETISRIDYRCVVDCKEVDSRALGKDIFQSQVLSM